MSFKHQTSPLESNISSSPDDEDDIRAENVYLRTLLFDLTHQHSRQSTLMENLKLLSDELENKAKSRQCEDEGEMMDKASGQNVSPSCAKQDQETIDVHVTISNKFEEERLTAEKESEENNKWGKHYQERGSCSQETMCRMLWLEGQLVEAKQALEDKDNDDRIIQMNEHYANLLEKSKKALDELRLRLDETQHDLLVSQKWCLKSETEVEKLKVQLRTQRVFYQTENKQLRDKMAELEAELEDEQVRSAYQGLQSVETQKWTTDLQKANQKTIAELEHQIQMLTGQMQDEREDSSSLKSKMVKIVKVLRGHERHNSTF